MKKILELKQARAKVISEARAIVEKADTEGRELTIEERDSYDGLLAKVDNMGQDIERREKLEGFDGVHKPDPAIGMSGEEVRRYSLIRAIRAAANSAKDPHAWDDAALEMEASRAVAEKIGRDPQGFFVPTDYLESRSGMVKGTDANGGFLVADELKSQSFIDMLRNKMVLNQAGAQVMGGLVGDVLIPRQTGGATAYWVSEGGDITESDQTIGQVSLSPKTVGAYTDISRKLLLQSSIDVEQMVRNDLATVLALAIDLAGLHGTGANNQPTGIAATSGIGSVVGGDNGAAPTLAHLINLETEVSVDNADMGKLAYITNPKVRGKLKQTARVSSTDSLMVWADGNTPLNGYPAYISNQVKANLTKGTSTSVCSAIFYGNWADLIIGMWGGLDVLVDPYTGSKSGTVRVVEMQDVDVAVRHAESFAAMLDALTA